MLVRIDPSTGTPIYLQIASEIVSQIEAGGLESGSRLPSARSLAASLKVNMHTVLRAYGHLQDLGYVDMKRGRGGVVVRGEPAVEVAAQRLVAAARQEGMTPDEVSKLVRKVWL